MVPKGKLVVSMPKHNPSLRGSGSCPLILSSCRGQRLLIPLIAVPLLLSTGVVLAFETETVQELKVEWTFNTSDVFPGKLFGAGHQGCQTVWDVDGDGVNEVVFGTRRGDSRRLWCIDQGGSFEWVFPPVGEEGLPGDPMSKVSLVDVDNDGDFELCFAGRGGRLYVLEGNGSLKWAWDNPTGSNMEGPPQAFDVDGDGFVEFFINDNAGFIHRVSHSGQLIYTSFRAERENDAPPTIADVDRDGEFEVLWASGDHNVYCMDANTGEQESGRIALRVRLSESALMGKSFGGGPIQEEASSECVRPWGMSTATVGWTWLS